MGRVDDPIEKLLWEVQTAESGDRATLARIVEAHRDVEVAVERVSKAFPEWRLGQAYCNVLRVARPDLYLELVGTEADPFYRDDRVPRFRDWLAARMR